MSKSRCTNSIQHSIWHTPSSKKVLGDDDGDDEVYLLSKRSPGGDPNTSHFFAPPLVRQPVHKPADGWAAEGKSKWERVGGVYPEKNSRLKRRSIVPASGNWIIAFKSNSRFHLLTLWFWSSWPQITFFGKPTIRGCVRKTLTIGVFY